MTQTNGSPGFPGRFSMGKCHNIKIVTFSFIKLIFQSLFEIDDRVIIICTFFQMAKIE